MRQQKMRPETKPEGAGGRTGFATSKVGCAGTRVTARDRILDVRESDFIARHTYLQVRREKRAQSQTEWIRTVHSFYISLEAGLQEWSDCKPPIAL